MNDRYGRVLEDLRITVTHACNFSCFFCHMEGEESREKNLTAKEIGLVARVATDFGITTAKLTGGEPTIRRDIVEIVRELKNAGIKEVSMTTNGVLLPLLAWKLKDAGLDRVNISLHAIDREVFKKITGVDALDKVIEGIRSAIEADLRPIKLNYVFTTENQSQLYKVIEFAEKLGVDELHLIEMHPVGLGKTAFKYHKDLNDIEKKLEELAVNKEIRRKHYRPRYKLPSGLVIEVVKPYANPIFCAGCNRVRLTADGYIKTCLYRNDNTIEILDILRGNHTEEEKIELLREAFELAIAIREPNFKYNL